MRGAQLWIRVLSFAGLFVLFWLSGVGSDATSQTMAVSGPHPDLQDGKAFWNGGCVACHEVDGMGGPRATQCTRDVMPVVTFPVRPLGPIINFIPLKSSVYLGVLRTQTIEG